MNVHTIEFTNADGQVTAELKIFGKLGRLTPISNSIPTTKWPEYEGLLLTLLNGNVFQISFQSSQPSREELLSILLQEVRYDIEIRFLSQNTIVEPTISHRPKVGNLPKVFPELTDVAASPADNDSPALPRHEPIINYDDGTKVGKDYTTREVLAGTNRKMVSGASAANLFSADYDELSLLACKVSIPGTHKPGSIERPGFWSRLFGGESPAKHIAILSTRKLTETSWMEQLQSSASSNNEALLFVHGYNNTFAKAIYRTAQLSHDLNWSGPALAYTWPSMGTTSGYVADIDKVRLSIPHFIQFALKVISSDRIKKLHIIAHSMGNELVTQSFSQCVPLRESAKIEQLVLAAPDIDQDVFENVILPILGRTPRLTMYASSHDRALQASTILRVGRPRLGLSGESLFVHDRIDSIDASGIHTDLLGHGYFGDSGKLINDIGNALKGMSPVQRNLVERARNNLKFYII